MRSRAFSTRRTALWQNLSGLWPQSFPAPLRLRLCHDLAELYRVTFEGDLLLNFLPPESPIIDTRPAEEQFRNLKIAPLYFQPNFRRESARRKPTRHPDMNYIGLLFVLGVLLPMIFGLFRFLLGNPA